MHSVFGKINYGGLKHNSLYLGLVLPSGGWQSLILKVLLFYNNSLKWIVTEKDLAYFEPQSVKQKKNFDSDAWSLYNKT